MRHLHRRSRDRQLLLGRAMAQEPPDHARLRKHDDVLPERPGHARLDGAVHEPPRQGAVTGNSVPVRPAPRSDREERPAVRDLLPDIRFDVDLRALRPPDHGGYHDDILGARRQHDRVGERNRLQRRWGRHMEPGFQFQCAPGLGWRGPVVGSHQRGRDSRCARGKVPCRHPRFSRRRVDRQLHRLALSGRRDDPECEWRFAAVLTIDTQGHQFLWRRRRDSNPGYTFLGVCSLSRGVPSTTRPRLREGRDSTGRALAASNKVSKKSPAKTGSYADSGALSSSNARCSTRTASSRYFSSITTEILISEVEIIWMLIAS